jgi:hypothetical protein
MMAPPWKEKHVEENEYPNKPYPTIYDGLRTAFEKPRYQDILEDEWPQVEQWFKVQIERARKAK